MATSWSPILAKYVTDGGVVRDSPSTTISSGYSASSPTMDDEPGDKPPRPPSSQSTTSYEVRQPTTPDQNPQMVPHHPIPPSGINHTVVVPVATAKGHFSCPQCPRKFPSFAKSKNFRHAYHCLATGCGLSFEQPKDLFRHSDTHLAPERRTRPHCEFPGCNETFSRRDGLKRHIERYHPSEA